MKWLLRLGTTQQPLVDSELPPDLAGNCCCLRPSSPSYSTIPQCPSGQLPKAGSTGWMLWGTRDVQDEDLKKENLDSSSLLCPSSNLKALWSLCLWRANSRWIFFLVKVFLLFQKPLYFSVNHASGFYASKFNYIMTFILRLFKCLELYWRTGQKKIKLQSWVSSTKYLLEPHIHKERHIKSL